MRVLSAKALPDPERETGGERLRIAPHVDVSLEEALTAYQTGLPAALGKAG